MLMHHTSESAKSRLNPESHWLVNGSFLLTERFCKNYMFSVTSLWCTFVNLFVVMHPTHILVHPSGHRLKSAGLDHEQSIGETIVKLLSQNFSQVVQFKLFLRDISLGTFFLNGLRCELRECRGILPQYICEWTICAV